ncbi:MAG: VOC family protein [Acidimicrobiia bacterium]|nr:MAG: VOC family protein [Acidimicrobiia bacterium]
MGHRIVPHLWFDNQAADAAAFYADVFPESSVVDQVVLHDTPSGDVDVVWFEVWGQPFQAISAGPLVSFNPSVSFTVTVDSPDQVDWLWGRLTEGGAALMPLDAYPWSERYGWVADRFGLSWQLMYRPDPPDQRITPSLLFTGDVSGRAEEAVTLYTSVFPDSKIEELVHWGPDEPPEVEGTVKQAVFTLDGYRMTAMDSAYPHGFGFNEAISLVVMCDTQEEIDRYWEALSAVPEAEQCGWLKDRFGLSWQIVPGRMDEMLRSAGRETRDRLTRAFLPMKKIDLAELERVFAER